MTDHTDELAGLPEDVREHVANMDARNTVNGSWNACRAELLRLDKINRILEIKNAGTLANNLCPDHRDKQTSRPCLACLLGKSESELAAAHHERDRMFLDAREWATRFGEMEARAERAEAELAAALKANRDCVDHFEQMQAELAESRETIKRLNRRVQVAEAGVVEKVKASGGSLGRALANAAADRYMRERDEAQAELAALKARIAGGELGVVAGPMKYSQAPVIFAEPDRAMALIGQRVALVKVED